MAPFNFRRTTSGSKGWKQGYISSLQIGAADDEDADELSSIRRSAPCTTSGSLEQSNFFEDPVDPITNLSSCWPAPKKKSDDDLYSDDSDLESCDDEE